MHYFDTCFIAPFFLKEDMSQHVRKAFESLDGECIVSSWTESEFTGIVSKYVRMKKLTELQAFQILDSFKTAMMTSFTMLIPTKEDFDLTNYLLRHFHTGLRTGDALHLAI